MFIANLKLRTNYSYHNQNDSLVSHQRENFQKYEVPFENGKYFNIASCSFAKI